MLTQRLREVVLAILLLAGSLRLFVGKHLTGEHTVATFADNTHFMLPLFSHISKSFAAGEFPYWVNSIAGGIPIYNTPQFSLLYPLYFFRWNLYRTPYSWVPLALASVFLILENEHPRIGLVMGWVSVYLLVSASPAQPLKSAVLVNERRLLRTADV